MLNIVIHKEKNSWSRYVFVNYFSNQEIICRAHKNLLRLNNKNEVRTKQ